MDGDSIFETVSQVINYVYESTERGVTFINLIRGSFICFGEFHHLYHFDKNNPDNGDMLAKAEYNGYIGLAYENDTVIALNQRNNCLLQMMWYDIKIKTMKSLFMLF